MARGDSCPWVRQRVHQAMQVLGHKNRVFRGVLRVEEGSHQVRPAVPQEALHISSGHQLQQDEARGSPEAEPHTTHDIPMTELAEWGGAGRETRSRAPNHSEDLCDPGLAASQPQGRKGHLAGSPELSLQPRPVQPQVHLMISASMRKSSSS
jgi:hypothetical protein